VKATPLNLSALIALVLFLSGCSSTPTSLQLAPQLSNTTITTPVQKDHSWLLASQDLRTARYLIAISSGDKVATLVNESVSTRAVIEKTLQAQWAKQGFTFTTDSNNSYQIDIQLIKLLAEVEQSTLSHEADINAVIKIQLNSEKTTFSKTFRSHYQKKAPFNANVDTLTQQLNIQLSQLLDQIVQDSELNDKLLQL